jgi:hypothetical protein
MPLIAIATINLLLVQPFDWGVQLQPRSIRHCVSLRRPGELAAEEAAWTADMTHLLKLVHAK